jgi:hypothetical protein
MLDVLLGHFLRDEVVVFIGDRAGPNDILWPCMFRDEPFILIPIHLRVRCQQSRLGRVYKQPLTEVVFLAGPLLVVRKGATVLDFRPACANWRPMSCP